MDAEKHLYVLKWPVLLIFTTTCECYENLKPIFLTLERKAYIVLTAVTQVRKMEPVKHVNVRSFSYEQEVVK